MVKVVVKRFTFLTTVNDLLGLNLKLIFLCLKRILLLAIENYFHSSIEFSHEFRF